MVHELELKPGWLSADMQKAAERVREWAVEKSASQVEARSEGAEVKLKLNTQDNK